jgi:hypothetical protein
MDFDYRSFCRSVDHEKLHHQTIDQYSKMLAVVQDASGSVDAFTWEKLKKMSAAYFFNALSPNMRITFSLWREKNE